MSMRGGVLGGVEARVRRSACECGNWGEVEGYAHEFGAGVRDVRRGSVHGEGECCMFRGIDLLVE